MPKQIFLGRLLSALMKVPAILIALIMWGVIDATPLSAEQGSAEQASAEQWKWETLQTIGRPTARHEATLVAFRDKVYLIGGRRINPVDVYDPSTNTWTAASPTPIELHHFQAVVVDDAIYLIGAMTGPYPNEKPLEKIVVYYPEKDQFEFVHHIPESRRRGGAGAVYYDGKIYIVGGITNGHVDGFQPWLDQYDPKTGEWVPLADASHARDHFQAVVLQDKLYCLGGRTTSKATNQVFSQTVAAIDVYDLQLQLWLQVTDDLVVPTPRAGNMATVWGNEIVIGGGESEQKTAHRQVEAYNVWSRQWRQWPRLNRGRHGSGFAIVADYMYTASGSGNRGGSPELASTERLRLPALADAE
ncbi:galactose oxidase [Stieleria sp. TO1_6]|uniref:Kelch repeat-containing protein n=1 Tax=Stieleria tagensis TaxID=2956795 RepID=UPI00209AB621|nr:kelch repeat-containing protein [Stieleria tagensis]MCO8123398.1 galactose oxidase [Stieleria tagensis]